MKKYIVVLCSILILISSFKEVNVYMDYYINFDFISSTLCINRDLPSQKCNGKCYLKDQLNKAQESKGEKRTTKELKLKLTYFLENTSGDMYPPELGKQRKKIIHYKNHLLSTEWDSKLIKPPIFA